MKPRTVILTIEVADCTLPLTQLHKLDRIFVFLDDVSDHYMDRDAVVDDPTSGGQIVQVQANVVKPKRKR